MYPVLDHPEVSWALRTGYPSWMQEEEEEEEFDEDAAYEERREAAHGERWERCQWQEERPERVAAVDS